MMTESFDPATSLLLEGEAKPSFRVISVLRTLVLPQLSLQLPSEQFFLSHPLPPLTQSTASIFPFFFFFNRRKASPPNLIPAPLSQADVTFTSVRLLKRPVSSSPADVAAAEAAAAGGRESKVQVPLLAARGEDKEKQGH